MILRVRLALLIVGIAAFAFAMRNENEIARWVGIGCVAIALVLRFLGRAKD
jgi:hypothetical protein